MTNWNFSRPELAEKYLDIFSTGLFSNLAIIEVTWSSFLTQPN